MTASISQPTISPRLPLPATVHIFNGFFEDYSRKHQPIGSSTNDDVNNNPQSHHDQHSLLQYWRDHSSSLLHPIRLELIVCDGDLEEHRIYSQTKSSGTIQPVWHHLAESIDKATLSVDAYDSMMLRLFVQQAPTASQGHKDGEFVLWQQWAIHPSKLVRMGALPDPTQQRLPLNFMVVEYTDNSLRTTSALYQLLDSATKKEDVEKLLRKKQQAEAMGIVDDDEIGRFKDNAFSALDRQNKQSSSQDGANVIPPIVIDKTRPPAQQLVAPPPDVAALRQRAALLREAIGAHEQALQEEMQQLESEAALLRDWHHQLGVKERQTREVYQATAVEEYKSFQLDVELQTQQVRLVRELRNIYPITVSGQRFGLRDLDFPRTLPEILMAPEEEISTVLGYTCHLVHMLSKYLAVQLRYRLLCHNSRSGIQDDRAVLYPLFQGRRVDREQLEHGITLLQRNVDCLCRDRNVVVSPKLHILGKVKRIYEHIIDGY